jgi:hypothetical protein
VRPSRKRTDAGALSVAVSSGLPVCAAEALETCNQVTVTCYLSEVAEAHAALVKRLMLGDDTSEEQCMCGGARERPAANACCKRRATCPPHELASHTATIFFLASDTPCPPSPTSYECYRVTMRMAGMTAAHDTQLAAKVVLAWSC